MPLIERGTVCPHRFTAAGGHEQIHRRVEVLRALGQPFRDQDAFALLAGSLDQIIRLGFADRPRDASGAQLYGVCVLCGIGFTMSLFIGLLAFPDAPELQGLVKLGVLAGSLLSAVLGSAILLLSHREARPTPSRVRAMRPTPR